MRGWLLGLVGLPLLAFGQVPQSASPVVASKINSSVLGSTSSAQPSAAPAELPAVPAGKVSLIGGAVRSVDHVRDALTLEIFGGGTTTLLFDPRTRIYRSGKPASLAELKAGDRVYADTVLDGKAIFARSIRIAAAVEGESKGQIVSFDANTRQLALRDALTSKVLNMRLSPDAAILRKDQPAAITDLRPGSLITLLFRPDRGGHSLVQQVSILAAPGAEFTFMGRLLYLNVARGLMVVEDPRDQARYEIHVDSLSRHLTDDLREGSDVVVSAVFDGSHYVARNVTVNRPAAANSIPQ